MAQPRREGEGVRILQHPEWNWTGGSYQLERLMTYRLSVFPNGPYHQLLRLFHTHRIRSQISVPERRVSYERRRVHPPSPPLLIGHTAITSHTGHPWSDQWGDVLSGWNATRGARDGQG